MLVHVPSHILSSLDWWMDPTSVCKGVPFAPPQSLTLVMDALDLSWGAYLEPLQNLGLWSPQDLYLYINIRKLWIVQLACMVFLPHQGHIGAD